jgi:hypothetical protein
MTHMTQQTRIWHQILRQQCAAPCVPRTSPRPSPIAISGPDLSPRAAAVVNNTASGSKTITPTATSADVPLAGGHSRRAATVLA